MRVLQGGSALRPELTQHAVVVSARPHPARVLPVKQVLGGFFGGDADDVVDARLVRRLRRCHPRVERGDQRAHVFAVVGVVDGEQLFEDQVDRRLLQISRHRC